MLSCEVQEGADDEGMVGHYTVYMHSIIFILFCNFLTLLVLTASSGIVSLRMLLALGLLGKHYKFGVMVFIHT